MSKKALFFLKAVIVKRSVLLLIVFFSLLKAGAQSCSLQSPQLFGLSQQAVYCRDNPVPFGVLVSQSDQQYTFNVREANGTAVKSKGGPLDGNGSQLSVASYMRSARDAGLYRVVSTKPGCAQTASSGSFFAYYGNIDNLTITSWGSNAVAFRWAACGPIGDVTYEYAVTNVSDPNAGTFVTQTTPDTTAFIPNGLANGTTYYIHVRVSTVSRNGNTVQPYNCPGGYPWQTMQFVACSGSAPIGSLAPLNTFVCSDNSTILTASGGPSYQWYKDDVLMGGQTAATLNVGAPGQYKTYITTAAGCQGQVYSASVVQTSLLPGKLSGSGGFCAGDSVTVGIINTRIGQTYTIRRNGVDVTAPVNGIGTANESPDTMLVKFLLGTPSQAGLYTLRTSNGFCSPLDSGSVNFFSYSSPISGLIVNNITEFSANFSWSAPGPGAVNYEYAVTTTPATPFSGSMATANTALVSALMPSTNYYFHVRPKCGQGAPVAWSTLPFTTLAVSGNCAGAVNASLCTAVTVSLGAGTGTWNFIGNYPANSTGSATPGKERIVTFTPAATGVYYLDVTAATGTISYLYKSASTGCSNTGWTGIRDVNATGKYAVGMLQGGITYLLVLDNTDTTASSHTFKLCRATVAPPSALNTCNSYYIPLIIPAGSPKEEFIIDEAGHVIAGLDFSKVSYDQVTIPFSYYVNAAPSPVRRDITNREYLDRVFTLNTSNDNTNPVGIRLFFTNNELNRLINEPDDGISDVVSIDDLYASTAGYDCSYGSGNIASASTVSPILEKAAYDVDSKYVKFETTGYTVMTFYLHGGNAPLSTILNISSFEDFTTASNPAGWTQQNVSGNGSVLYPNTSVNPVTMPYGESRFAWWNSYNFPAGYVTRLISPRILTQGVLSVNVDFFWYNNNNPLYSTGNYLNEGVQVEYSLDGINWIPAGAFIPRHDPSLASGTGEWKKKRITLPGGAAGTLIYVAFKFRSEFGDNCGLDAISFIPTPDCNSLVNSISATNITTNTVNFNWPAVAGVSQYDYYVSDNPHTPYYGWTTSSTSAGVPYIYLSSLAPSTLYYINVRPRCPGNSYGGWTTLRFSTPVAAPDCNLGAEDVYESGEYTATIQAGTGVWDFSGTYPFNSDGYPTPGIEKLYRFTPNVSGIYYLEVLSGDNWVDYFYKPASDGCGSTGWKGIDDMLYPGKRGIGMLQAGQSYYILLDNESSVFGATQTFMIKMATVGMTPPGSCNSYYLPNTIPANSNKEEYIIDDYGNVIAGFDFHTVSNAVGYVSVSVYDNNGPIRKDIAGRKYLDRSITVTPENAPANPVGMKFFFTRWMLNRLSFDQTDGLGDVTSIDDLKVTRLQQDCGSAALQGAASLLPQTSNSSDWDVYQVGFTTPGFSTFYLHGGNGPLETALDILCPGNNTTITMTSPGVGYTYQWQVDNGSGFTNIVNNTIYSGAATATLMILNPPTSFNGNKYRCIATNGNVQVSNDVKTIKFIATWNGFNDTAWENAGNWSCGILPDQYTSVIIPAGIINLPVVNSNASCKSVIANPGTTITVNPGFKLTVTGTGP